MNKENKENLIPVKGLSPFKRFCMTIGELPSSYLETMTYYEMLVWFTKYMQDTVIPTINNNASAVDELQNKYIEFTDNLLDRQTTFENNLTTRQENYEEEVMTLFNNLQDFVNNYFNNLDVQEEINNKLDQMVEDGILQEIIADYLNSKAIFGFDNVSDMISSTNLIDGSYARTLGYNSINDNNGGLYKIREITNQDVIDNINIISMNADGLVAELIHENDLICFSTVNDMKNHSIVNGYAKTLGFNNINDGGGCYYKIRKVENDDTIDNVTLISIGNGDLVAELIFNDVMTTSQFGIQDNVDGTTNFQIAVTKMENKKLIIDNILILSNSITLPNNIEIDNKGQIKYGTDLIYLFKNENNNGTIILNNLYIEKTDNSFNNLNRFIYVNGGNLTINNSEFHNYKTAIHLNLGERLICNNCEFYEGNGILAQSGYGIDTSAKYNTISNIKFENTNNTNGRHCIYLNGDIMINTNINNCYVKNWHHNPIQINVSNSSILPLINIENCKFINTTREATGSDPNSNIGCINIAQDSYGEININNIIGKNLIKSLIASQSSNSKINITNCKAYHDNSTTTNMFTIYLRFGNDHSINNLFSDISNDTNFKNVIYIRNINRCFINNITTNGNNGNSLVYANNSNVILGLYSTDLTTITDQTSGSFTPYSLYNV